MPRKFEISFLLVLSLVLSLAPGVMAQPYVRQVEAFTVRNAEGAAYTHPWLGGLNVPRPQFVDLDADGDADLFVQERSGQLLFFENTGAAGTRGFTWRTDAYAGLDVGEWARFADLDADGDFDLLAQQGFNLVRLYRNVGTPQAPNFTAATDTLRATFLDAQGVVRDTLILADPQNLPTLADLDADGLPDLFLASQAGTLTYYAHQGLDADGLPAFRFVTDRYEDIEVIGGLGKNERALVGFRYLDFAFSRHGANAIAFADVDGDDDLDLLWGDFFSPSLYFIENTGTRSLPTLDLTSAVFPTTDPLETSGFNVPAFADLDDDGNADLFVGVLGGAFGGGPFAADNFYFYERDDGTFTLRTRQFISSLDVGQESTPAFADLDDDGDLDLVVGNKIDPVTGRRAQLFLFENEGTPTTPDFRLTSEALVRFDNRFNTAPALADLDDDGDLDLLLGSFSGAVAFYRNDGTAAVPAFTLLDPVLVDLGDTDSRGQNSAPALADLDDDGDLDLFVGEASGAINFFRNVGTPQQPDFVLETEMFAGLDVGMRSAPAFFDLDRDGVLDLIVGTRQEGVAVYRNGGTPQEASFGAAEPFGLPGTPPRLAAPAFADLDADGDADFFVGGLRGGLFFYRNERIATATEPAPETPPDAPASLSNHPNPFRAATTLSVRLARPARVRLVVYDVLGRAVATLLDGPRPSGEHRVVFDARGLPAGVYLYRLTTNDGAARTGTMVQVR